MARDLDDVSRLLGSLEEAVSGLSRRFDRVEERMDERDETLEEMQRAAQFIANDVRYLKEVLVEDVKPVTDEVKRWKQQGMGALAIIGIGGTAFGAAFIWLLSQLGWVKMP